MQFADNQTLVELKIIRNSNSSLNLVDRLDRTATVEGKENYINYLKNPLLNLEEINNFQILICSIQKKLKLWLPFQKLLLSDTFTRVRELKSKQLLYRKPFLSLDFSILFPKKVKANRDLINSLIQITDSIKSSSKHPSIIDELQQKIEDFRIIVIKKRNINFNNWYCFNHKYKEYCQILEILFKLDAFISIAKIHDEYKLVFPTWSNNKHNNWYFKGLFNILLDNPVKNDIEISKHTKNIFITGPNMAGKSTIMSAIGQAIYLSRCGFGVPADGAILPFVENLLTAFETVTSIECGLSYFGNEVKRSIEAIELCKKDQFTVLLIDELFKGTNIKDSQDCLKYFIDNINNKNALCVISTHLLDLVKSYNNKKSDFIYFRANTNNHAIDFDYKLYNGISDQRLGLKIFKNQLT